MGRSDGLRISAAQCRAARAVLGWSQAQLASVAVVSRATIADFEREARQPIPQNVAALARAVVAGGVELVGDCGVDWAAIDAPE